MTFCTCEREVLSEVVSIRVFCTTSYMHSKYTGNINESVGLFFRNKKLVSYELQFNR